MKKIPAAQSVVTSAIASMTLLWLGCEKGGSNFSILSSTNQFEQQITYEPRKLDVLFTVDNSGSMSSSQSALAANFPSFINYFKDKGFDFRIAVTTTDAFYGDQFVSSGCSLCTQSQTRFRSGTNPKIYVIDKNTPNMENVFTQNISVGTAGSGDERAFSSFKAALNSPLNAGFHRADAYLAVILVSDEEDFSHDDINLNESYSQPTLHTVASYKTYLQNFTSGAASSDFSVSTISILDDTCKTSLGPGRKVGLRYMQLADQTGGSKNSLCSSFDNVLNSISTHIANQVKAEFFLDRIPVHSSIRVIVEGILVPEDPKNGWSYDPAANSIQLHGTSAPAAGTQVTINFDPESVGS